jgi:N-acyl homoserine lactone hydrolase
MAIRAGLALATALAALAVGPAATAATAPVKLWRLDCGTLWVADLDDYSDTHAFSGQSRRFTVSGYLIRHGDAYMLWDAGLSKDLLGKPLVEGPVEGATLKTTLVDQLAAIGVRPEQVSILGVSHRHFDHIGQAGDFPGATLLIGKDDLATVRARGGEDGKSLAHWANGPGKAEPVERDKDVFGDGSVVMLDLPGHTPGHHGLLVRLARAGHVLLSGDVAHFRENLIGDGLPVWNTDRADSLASMDRFRALGRNLKAVVVIQHDERDVAKLPAFPKAME